MEELVEIRKELGYAIPFLSEAGLMISCNFDAELLAGVEEKIVEIKKEGKRAQGDLKGRIEKFCGGNDKEEDEDEGDGDSVDYELPPPAQKTSKMSARVQAKVLLARSHMSMRQYHKAASAVEGCHCLPALSLHSYSRYLNGERRREEENLEKGATSKSYVVNRELIPLRSLLSSVLEPLRECRLDASASDKDSVGVREKGSQSKSKSGRGGNSYSSTSGYNVGGDGVSTQIGTGSATQSTSWKFDHQTMVEWDYGICLYVYGLVLKRLANTVRDQEAARAVLCDSVSAFPANWGAWAEIADLCPEMDILQSLQLPDHWMKELFLAQALMKFRRYLEAIVMYDSAEKRFGPIVNIVVKKAIALYESGQVEEAALAFQEVRRLDPQCMEGMVYYSHILYVRGERAKLSDLAHYAMGMDGNKFSFTTCCIVGNYYELQDDHRNAILYFRRALRLNRRYVGAWILIGHAFLSMGKANQAKVAYRTAVTIDPTDCKAWYCLGHAYHMLKLNNYSVYYFLRAAALQPYDARMWIALGEAYQNEKRARGSVSEDMAIKCYQRALDCCNDKLGDALNRLGKIFRSRANAAVEPADRASFEKDAYFYFNMLVYKDSTLQIVKKEDRGGVLSFLLTHASIYGDEAERMKFHKLIMESKSAEGEKLAIVDVDSVAETSMSGMVSMAESSYSEINSDANIVSMRESTFSEGGSGADKGMEGNSSSQMSFSMDDSDLV